MRLRTSATIHIAPAVSEAGIVVDLLERGIHVAEFLPDAFDEGAHIGAEADLALAGREARSVHDVVKLAIADILAGAAHQIFDNAKFGQRQIDAAVLPIGAVDVAAQMDVALLDDERLARLGLAFGGFPALETVDDELDPARKNRKAARFFDEVDGAAQEAGLFVDLIAQNGEKHHRHVDLLPAQFTQDLDSGHSGHLPIEQDDVGNVLSEVAERRRAVFEPDRRKACIGQILNQGFAEHSVVIDDQNLSAPPVVVIELHPSSSPSGAAYRRRYRSASRPWRS